MRSLHFHAIFLAVYVACFLSVLGGRSEAQTFTHPGILNSQADLDRIKQMVAGGVSPWKESFAMFSNDPLSQSTYTATPTATVTGSGSKATCCTLSNDATAAYQTALMWYITGNTAYATASINIINSWATLLTSYQSSLDITAYDVGLKFSAAAEILRYEPGSGWTTTDTTNLTSMLVNQIMPALITSNGTMIATDGNQGIGVARGAMAIAIATDNTNLFNTAVNLYEGNTDPYTTNPCVAVTYYIDQYGGAGESGRDQAHPQGGLASFAEMAKMAELQGVDLWGYANNRLMLGLENIAAFNLGNAVAWTNHGTCNTQYTSQSLIDRGVFTDTYEMAYNHYVVAKGLSMPYSAQVLKLIRPELGATDDPGYGTLLYTVSPYGPPPSYEGTYQINNLNSGLTVGTVNGATSQNTHLSQASNSLLSTQQWRMIPLGNEVYRIYSEGGTPAFVIDSGSSPTKYGTDTHLWGNGNGVNQMWGITPSTGGVQVVARDSLLAEPQASQFPTTPSIFPLPAEYWDITGASTASGALLEMNIANGGNDERFTLSPVYSRIQASSFSDRSGSGCLESSSEGGQDVCGIADGDWTKYSSVNLSGANQIYLRVATPNSGGTIEVHLGSPTGSLLGTVQVNYTSGAQTYGTVLAPISGAPAQASDIYLVARGNNANLFNLLWFTFAGPMLQATTTTLTAPADLVPSGTAVTLTATVAASVSVPTGTITFAQGGTTLCTATLNSTGGATCSYLPSTSGVVNVTATYQGDVNHATSSSSLTLTVYDASVSLQLSGVQLIYPGAANVTVCVSPATSATATGTAMIVDGTTALATISLQGGGCGYWYISPGLAAGTHSFTAMYSGDANNAAGTSSPTAVTVSPVPTNMSVSCWNASFAYGANYQCTVNASSNAGAVQGAITYIVDSGSATSVSLSGGNAQFAIARPPVGNHTVTVAYAQQTNYAAASPQSESFSVTAAPVNVSLSPSSWYFSSGTSVSFQAAVTSWSAGPPSNDGTISFYDGSTLLTAVPVDANGTASFSSTNLSVGSHTITATYAGGANYSAGSASATISVSQ